jgi:endogenous inhibitor of DNA gyrase (YacG/DUF329 family)
MMRCPVCKRQVDLSRANRFRPFCSERCRLTDLGRWAQEGYRVAGEPQSNSESNPASGDESGANGHRSGGNNGSGR